MHDDLARALKASPLCRDLDDSELQDLASRGRVERWSAGSLIMEEGLGGPRLVVLLEGEVQITKTGADRQDHTIAKVGPGGVLGELSLLCDAPRSATVKALCPLRLFAMDRGVFQGMLADRSTTATKLVHSLARVLAWRLVDASERMVGLLETSRPHDLEAELTQLQAHLHSDWGFGEPNSMS